jgi:hypothetical protein
LRIGGHRGAPDVAPENTFSSFEAAVAAGADYVEMDVQRSADGTLIIIHDGTLERTTNGKGAIAQTQLTDMLRLDAGSWFGEGFASQRMPTFEEFMSLAPRSKPKPRGSALTLRRPSATRRRASTWRFVRSGPRRSRRPRKLSQRFRASCFSS